MKADVLELLNIISESFVMALCLILVYRLGVVYGEGNKERIAKEIKNSWIICMALSVAVAIVCFFVYPRMVDLFVGDNGPNTALIKQNAVIDLYFVCLATPFYAANNIFTSVYEVRELVKHAHLNYALETCVLFILYSVVLSPLMGVTGLWAAYPAAEASTLLVAAGPFIPAAFDIKDPVLLKECRHALWIYALACPGLSIVANFNSFYINTNKPYLAAMESILNNLVCILVLAIPFGMRFGLQGMMLGYAMAPYLTAVILLSYIYFHYGKERFPDLLPPSDDVILNRTIVLKEEEIMKFIRDSHEILEANHADKKVEHSVELVLEEVLFLIMEKNRLTEHGKKPRKIYAEICERISSEGVDLSVWDSGEIFDITEIDSELINFRSYFISRVLSRQEVKKHMVATSFNRNFFHFGENTL